MAKQTARRICECRCGQPTAGGMYRPGHDAKHVAFLVSWVAAGWSEGYGGECGIRWARAIDQLPSIALQNKFRRSMRKMATTHRRAEASSMADAEWQRALYLIGFIQQNDPALGGMTNVEAIAEVAAAMGLSQRAVNYRRS